MTFSKSEIFTMELKGLDLGVFPLSFSFKVEFPVYLVRWLMDINTGHRTGVSGALQHIVISLKS